MSESDALPNELYYLDPDFSIRSLRKYQIKDILLGHNIKLPSNATKLDYIMSFNQDILPRREVIIKEHSQLIKQQTEEKEEYGRGHRAHVKPQRLEDVPEQTTRRRRRRSVVKNTNESSHQKDKDGFTMPLPLTRKSTRKAKLGLPVFTKEDALDRTYKNDEDDGEYVPYKREEDSDEEEHDLGEIEQEELEALRNDQLKPVFGEPGFHMMTRSQRADSIREQTELWRRRLRCIAYIVGVICAIIALAGLCITGYARNKNGYCQNFPQRLIKTNATQFFHLPPSCIPCPDHGICSKGQLTCDALYERKTPFYNIGGLLPIGDDCIHNSVLGKYVNRVEHRIKNQLARHQGEKTCEYLIAHPEMDITDALPIARLKVKDVLSQLKIDVQNTLPADKVDEIMMIALTSVLEDPKIHYTEVDGERYFGTENIKFSFTCHLTRLYYATSLKMKISILSSLAVVVLLICLIKEHSRRTAYENHIHRLTKMVLEKLKEKSDIHKQTKSASSTVSVSELRSAIVDINNPVTLNDWVNVVQKIEANPYVIKSFNEKQGQPVEYWELIT